MKFNRDIPSSLCLFKLPRIFNVVKAEEMDVFRSATMGGDTQVPVGWSHSVGARNPFSKHMTNGLVA